MPRPRLLKSHWIQVRRGATRKTIRLRRSVLAPIRFLKGHSRRPANLLRFPKGHRFLATPVRQVPDRP
jgi:hypothetical protein